MHCKMQMVDVAQLVRALVCGTRGRGFESHLPPHILGCSQAVRHMTLTHARASSNLASPTKKETQKVFLFFIKCDIIYNILIKKEALKMFNIKRRKEKKPMKRTAIKRINGCWVIIKSIGFKIQSNEVNTILEVLNEASKRPISKMNDISSKISKSLSKLRDIRVHVEFYNKWVVVIEK